MSNKGKKLINFKEIEKNWKEFWEKEKIYKFNPDKEEVYSIDTPPPYVSGKMHIGHAFSYSQQDFIARFWRMYLVSRGGSVFYPFGTDDNGLPTERFVERKNKIKSKSMPRSEFVELCLKTLQEITPEFVQDWKDLGLSADFELYYSTIDKPTQKISQSSFVELYKKGEIYKKEFPTLWCIECQTSIAQAELEDKQQESFFSKLKFKISDTGKELLIATTRPELLGACVAVFVNPDDERYKDIIGKKAVVPLFNFEVPIIADSSADPEKGTGVLMICSYGDKYDVEAINRHNLIPKVILDKNGILHRIEGYSGLRVKEARKKILEDLKNAGLIAEQEKIQHVVNVHDKCGTEIEFIPTEQWFIKILDKKKELIEIAKKINWRPEFMFKRYENWVKGLEWDWSISRDRHFGVPIPVWECKKCKEIILPSEDELPVDPLETEKKCPSCNSTAEPERRVLDTWATSSLTPQIASSLVDGKVRIPFSLRPQAHDIIRTWAFYTIVKSYLHEKKIPWENIMISGFVTYEGEKMSKSKGNVINPREVMDEYGADVLRFWAAGSKLGEDMDYNEKDIITGRRFVNKLLNASRFVFMNLEGWKNAKPEKFCLLDELFLAKLNSLIERVTSNFKEYDYSHAKAAVERFFWHDFCDNYLEIVKKRIYQGDETGKLSAQYTLYNSLLTIIKLIAPIMPFITEEIYQKWFKKYENEKSIHISKWPEVIEGLEKYPDSSERESKLELLYEVVSKIRHEKTKSQKSMKAEIVLTLEKNVLEKLEGMLDDLAGVANAKEIREGDFSVEFV